MRSLLTLLTLCLFAPALASADAIPDQPPCPAGARRVIDGHMVIYCDPTTCATDGDCESGESCQMLGLCVASVTRQVSSSFPAMPGDTVRDVTFQDATATCEAGGACGGGTCEVARRCGGAIAPAAATEEPPTEEPPTEEPATDEPATAPAAEPEEDGGGCNVGAPRRAPAAALVVAFALALAAGRRRR